MPTGEPGSPEVRAKMMSWVAWCSPELKRFCPLMHPLVAVGAPPWSRGTWRRSRGSGSVRPKARRRVPSRKPGIHSAFCASVPKSRIISTVGKLPTIELSFCRSLCSPRPLVARCSRMIAISRLLASRPPNSAGSARRSQPAASARRRISREQRPPTPCGARRRSRSRCGPTRGGGRRSARCRPAPGAARSRASMKSSSASSVAWMSAGMSKSIFLNIRTARTRPGHAARRVEPTGTGSASVRREVRSQCVHSEQGDGPASGRPPPWWRAARPRPRAVPAPARRAGRARRARRC